MSEPFDSFCQIKLVPDPSCKFRNMAPSISRNIDIAKLRVRVGSFVTEQHVTDVSPNGSLSG